MLSVIIVNYNVKYFLEQCLHSVRAAATSLPVEVIVVDNNSSDGSQEYITNRFPHVQWIASERNSGFAKACNKGLSVAAGDYILFLNPDTIVAENSLHTAVRFLATHPSAGAVGVRMLDGNGRFLKESKRSFPSPLTSFYKLAGLARLFPRSKTFGRYHLGHLPENENHPVPVLAGAFMLLPRKVLDEVGSFDEAFFMYGEDVDLSYRIQKAGYQNWYLADAPIIHFKGESTRRGSLNYVRLFYKAMSQFVRKHYGGAQAGVFYFFIQAAILLRGLLSGVSKGIKRLGLPLIDALIIFGSFFLTKALWLRTVKPHAVYPNTLVTVAFTAFTLLFLLVAYYSGLYNKWFRQKALVRSTGLALLVLLAGYSLLPEHLRFSRGILVVGVTVSFSAMLLLRRVMVKGKLIFEAPPSDAAPYLLIAASRTEAEQLKNLLQHQHRHKSILGRIAVTADDADALLPWQQLAQQVHSLPARELVFCAGTLSYSAIIGIMPLLPHRLRLRFTAAGSGSVVGSDSSYRSGAVLGKEIVYPLALPAQRRTKRLVDVITAVLLLLTAPLHVIMHAQPGRLLHNAVQVLLRKKTWVGYLGTTVGLPRLRPSVLGPAGEKNPAIGERNRNALDVWYAQNSSATYDLRIISTHYRQLGN